MSLLRKNGERTSLARKLVSGLSALALAGGFVAFTAMSASAHTGDLNATAVCNTTTGQFDVTYKLTISNTNLVGSTMWRVGNSTFDGTPTSNAGMDRGPVASTGAGVYTLGTISVPGTSTKAPWAYAFTTWSDNFTKGSDGGDITLSGNCKAADKLDASASVSVTQPTCTTAAKLVYGESNHITWSGTPDSTSGPGSYSVTATAVSGHKFADGKTTKVFSGKLLGKDLSLCDKVTPTEPTITQATGMCVGEDWVETQASVVLADTSKYQYDNYGQDSTGKLELTAGTYTFHVTAKDGFTLQDGNGFVNGSITIIVEALTPLDCTSIPTQTVVFVQQACLPTNSAGSASHGRLTMAANTTVTGVFAPGTLTIPDVPGIRYEITLKNGDVANIPAGVWYLTLDGTKSGEPYFGPLTINAYPTGVQQLTGTTQWKFTPTDPRPCSHLAYTGANPQMVGVWLPLAGGIAVFGVALVIFARRLRLRKI